MVSAALLISALGPLPPVVRGWKKGSRATYRVEETMGEGDSRVEMRYLVQIRIADEGMARGTLSRRTFTIGGQRQGGVSARTAFTFPYRNIGPVLGSFDRSLGGGNALIWAFSSPGWGGTGFTGKGEKNGWHGSALFSDPAGSSKIQLQTHLRWDGWPQMVKVEVATPEGGYTAVVQRA